MCAHTPTTQSGSGRIAEETKIGWRTKRPSQQVLRGTSLIVFMLQTCVQIIGTLCSTIRMQLLDTWYLKQPYRKGKITGYNTLHVALYTVLYVALYIAVYTALYIARFTLSMQVISHLHATKLRCNQREHPSFHIYLEIISFFFDSISIAVLI